MPFFLELRQPGVPPGDRTYIPLLQGHSANRLVINCGLHSYRKILHLIWSCDCQICRTKGIFHPYREIIPVSTVHIEAWDLDVMLLMSHAHLEAYDSVIAICNVGKYLQDNEMAL